MSPRATRRLLAALCLLALTAGCNAVGPRAVRTARLGYNEAAVRTWNEQMLLNLVRLRYRDTPYFLEVTSVSTQYNLEAGVSAGATLGAGEADVDTSAGGVWTESPTITYSPLAGEQFVRQVLSPVSLEALFLLPQSGWSIERVLRCCVQRLNGLPNAPRAAGPTPDTEPEFRDFLTAARLLRELQVAGLLEMGVRPAPASEAAARCRWWPLCEEPEAEEEPPEFILRLSTKAAPAGVEDGRRELAGLLAIEGLEEGRETLFTVGTLDPDPGVLAIYPRSLMGAMFYLSQGVQPPPEHARRGWVTVTRRRQGDGEFDWGELTGGLFTVRSQADRPADAFIAVRYRGHWFYIADDDLESKTTFGLLTQLFSLHAGSAQGGSPLLTLPLG